MILGLDLLFMFLLDTFAALLASGIKGSLGKSLCGVLDLDGHMAGNFEHGWI